MSKIITGQELKERLLARISSPRPDRTEPGESIEPGDIVQMAPDCTNRAFAGCLMIVEEARPWGVIGYFLLVGSLRDEPGTIIIPYREENGKFKRIGKAAWLPTDWIITKTPL